MVEEEEGKEEEKEEGGGEEDRKKLEVQIMAVCSCKKEERV